MFYLCLGKLKEVFIFERNQSGEKPGRVTKSEDSFGKHTTFLEDPKNSGERAMYNAGIPSIKHSEVLTNCYLGTRGKGEP